MTWQKGQGHQQAAQPGPALSTHARGAMDKSLVTKATSPDEIPTPGYMFNEIARITQSSADACKV